MEPFTLSNISFYLTRNFKNKIALLPNQRMYDELKIAYDVKIGSRTVIPKNTIVTGFWISDNGLRFATETVYLWGNGQPISAESKSVNDTTFFNDNEILHTTSLVLLPPNKNRRIVKVDNSIISLRDINLNVQFFVSDTCEIKVYLTQNFEIIS